MGGGAPTISTLPWMGIGCLQDPPPSDPSIGWGMRRMGPPHISWLRRVANANCNRAGFHLGRRKQQKGQPIQRAHSVRFQSSSETSVASNVLPGENEQPRSSPAFTYVGNRTAGQIGTGIDRAHRLPVASSHFCAAFKSWHVFWQGPALPTTPHPTKPPTYVRTDPPLEPLRFSTYVST